MNVVGVFYPVGTRVRLASGGPAMIVVDVLPEASAAVVAWTWEGDVREEVIPTICLDLMRRRFVLDG